MTTSEDEGATRRPSRSQRSFAAAAGAQGQEEERERGGPRDRDPPPSYDGVDPEGTFKTFEKNVKLWCYESDIPKRKQGAKLLRALTGMAQLATEDLHF